MTDMDIDIAGRIAELERKQGEADRAKEVMAALPAPPPLSAFSKACTERQIERIRERFEAAQKAAREAVEAREAEAERVRLYLESVQPQLDEIDEKIAEEQAASDKRAAELDALRAKREKRGTPPPAEDAAAKPAETVTGKIGRLFGRDPHGARTNSEHGPYRPASPDELAGLPKGDPLPAGALDGWVNGQPLRPLPRIRTSVKGRK
jgi:hypothetical protein